MFRKMIVVLAGLSGVNPAWTGAATARTTLVSQTGFAASVKSRSLAAWEPVDPAFNGCSEGVCGRRGRNPQAVVQPGAKPGQTVYCPVSGAVFEVKESSPRADLNGEPLYLCCEACARYFAQHRDRVLRLRGLASGRSAK
jgi:hypothetical protein